MALIDYKKASDSLPHTWVVTAMEMYCVCPAVRRFVDVLMKE